jgi:hypothetical protein
MKQPFWHASATHTPPVPQGVPSTRRLQVPVEMSGAQVWQAFAGLNVPMGYACPAMKQPFKQEPLLQTSEFLQPVPSLTAVHAAVETAGWQLWHEFDGLRAPGAYDVPAMAQPLPHAPARQS